MVNKKFGSILKFRNLNIFKLALITFYILFIISSSVTEAALVPCGTEYKDVYDSNDQVIGRTIANPCTFCDLLKLIDNVISFGIMIIFPIAAIMIVIGGFYIMTARDKPSQMEKGKSIITTAIVGILIALLSWIVLDTIFKVLATNWGSIKTPGGMRLGPWNEINCS